MNTNFTPQLTTYTTHSDKAQLPVITKVIAFLIVSIIYLCTSFAFAQGNGNGGNGGQNPCNTSQPRPITGNQTPCPGTYETYCIENDRGYTSFEWDVPRAHAGNPPTGWEIVSGQGTECVTVLVGHKPGTMKVKVTDPICGTKVATLPVHPADAFDVNIAGPDTFCVNVAQVFNASIVKVGGNGNGNGNGNANFNGTMSYSWSVPAGWVINSGQGSSQINVTPGATQGQVSVLVNYTPATGNGNGGNNGNGVGGHNKTFCNTTASDSLDVFPGTNCGNNPPCPLPVVTVDGPGTVCSFDLENLATYTATLTAGSNVTYSWSVPTDWVIISGEGTNEIEVMAGFESGTVTVFASNNCGQDEASVFTTSEDCGTIDPLPVDLISFEAARSQASVLLTWATAQEKDNDHFIVERSLDGSKFEAIGKVKGNGTTNYQSVYKFIDDKASKAISYYRLKQVDTNGKFEYSKVKTVKGVSFADAEPIIAFPNPSRGMITVNLPAETAADANVVITSVTGQVVFQGTANDLTQNNHSIDLSRFNSGVYILNVTSGGESQSLRITKL